MWVWPKIKMVESEALLNLLHTSATSLKFRNWCFDGGYAEQCLRYSSNPHKKTSASLRVCVCVGGVILEEITLTRIERFVAFF